MMDAETSRLVRRVGGQIAALQAHQRRARTVAVTPAEEPVAMFARMLTVDDTATSDPVTLPVPAQPVATCSDGLAHISHTGGTYSGEEWPGDVTVELHVGDAFGFTHHPGTLVATLTVDGGTLSRPVGSGAWCRAVAVAGDGTTACGVGDVPIV